MRSQVYSFAESQLSLREKALRLVSRKHEIIARRASASELAGARPNEGLYSCMFSNKCTLLTELAGARPNTARYTGTHH